jgi:hypothetical protein
MQKNQLVQHGQRVAHPTSFMRLCTCALMGGALVLAGCAQPPPCLLSKTETGATGPTPRLASGDVGAGQIRVPDIGKAEAMTLVEDVLGQMHFTIEKADIASGLVRTRPLSGAQFFEFWRSDNVGPDNNLLANLHTIRRTVELNISQLAAEPQVAKRQADQLCIHCDVRVQRLSIPERQISSSARVYEMFSRSSPSLLRLTLDPQQQKKMAWIDLDSDGPLAEEILKRIEAKIASQVSNEVQSTGNET